MHILCNICTNSFIQKPYTIWDSQGLSEEENGVDDDLDMLQFHKMCKCLTKSPFSTNMPYTTTTIQYPIIGMVQVTPVIW
jgi:hypothetical protein